MTGGWLGGTGTRPSRSPRTPEDVSRLASSPGRLTHRPTHAERCLRGRAERRTPGRATISSTCKALVSLGRRTCSPSPPASSPGGHAFTIIDNDGTDPVTGTFAGLPEGATHDGRRRRPSPSRIRGGDGNDVVLTATDADRPTSSRKARPAAFFDEDVLIANPNTAAAPVTLTFLPEGGGTIVEHAHRAAAVAR